jgi:histidinol-phosphatase (PHP family)
MDAGKLLIPDYHTHTELCGHAVGTPEDYLRAAERQGLTGIGIADHFPLLPEADRSVAMSFSDLPEYVKEVEELKRRYPGYVFLGIEADYRPHTIDRVRALLEEYPFDYVIGSVHFLGPWGFDDERQVGAYSGRDIDRVWVEYLQLVGDAAESGAFTILGHLDLAKKFGYRPSLAVDVEIDRLVERIVGAEVLVEINTAGLRKPVKEIYPSLSILSRLNRAGVNITFGSDAHRPSEVGLDFERAVQLASEAGYTEYAALRPSDTGERAPFDLKPLPSL